MVTFPLLTTYIKLVTWQLTHPDFTFTDIEFHNTARALSHRRQRLEILQLARVLDVDLAPDFETWEISIYPRHSSFDFKFGLLSKYLAGKRNFYLSSFSYQNLDGSLSRG